MPHMINVFDISNVAISFFDLQISKTQKTTIEYVNKSGNWTRHLTFYPNGTANFTLRENGVKRHEECILVESRHILLQVYVSKPLYIRLMKLASYKNNHVFWVLSRELNLELI